MILGIAFFSLFTPNGKIIQINGRALYLFSIFPVTQGALLGGIKKGALLAGMVFLSQFAISMKLHLPGKAGQFINNMFFTFGRLTEKKIPFKAGQIIESIDERLLEVWDERTEENYGEKENIQYSHFSFLAAAMPIIFFAAKVLDHAVS